MELRKEIKMRRERIGIGGYKFVRDDMKVLMGMKRRRGFEGKGVKE